MSYTIRSFLELPLLVQDCILEHLDRVDLASMSATCRNLHHPALKYLYRNLMGYNRDDRYLIEDNLRGDPSLIRHIRWFTCYFPSLLRWMWIHTSPWLTGLDLQWTYIHGEDPDEEYSKFWDSIPRTNSIQSITCKINVSHYRSAFRRFNAFDNLTFLSIGNQLWEWSYTLQEILELLYAPSLEDLEVEYIADWRIQWRDSFKEAFPDLEALTLLINDEDYVMWGNAQDAERQRHLQPPSEVMWDTVLTLHRHSIFFKIRYYRHNRYQRRKSRRFLDYAPEYASRHNFDPTSLIQWHVESRENYDIGIGEDFFSIYIGVVSLKDFITILNAIDLIEFELRRMKMSLNLPPDAQPWIVPAICKQILIGRSHLLPNEIFDFSIHVPLDQTLEPWLIPECILSLPDLKSLQIFLKIPRKYDLQPRHVCTAARYSFRSLVTPNRTLLPFSAVKLTITRSSDPIWDVVYSDGQSSRWNPKENEADVGNVNFEMEVKDWFELSDSLEVLEMRFEGTY